VIHRAPVSSVDRTEVAGIPTTTVARTLIDVAARVSRNRLASLVDAALDRELTTVEELRAALARAERGPGRKGARQLREVLAVWDEPIKPGSPAETRLIRKLAEMGANDFDRQVQLHDEAGFIGRVDLASRARHLILEYDTNRWHNPRKWADEEERISRLKALGWAVESVTKLDLMPTATRLAAVLRSHPAT
jgi:very-short-patch-repair endonuclease